jgi:L-lactate dehydrogenase complex protein LldF
MILPKPFRSQIASALENQNLQAALDANATKRAVARQIAIETLDQDWESLRQRAHTIRAKTIAHLDTLLEQFSAKAQENGWIIHRAQSAEQAAEIVLKIARLNQAKLLAKSKSMVSEEIGLNHALQQAGLRVVETDFGEYIVQLRHERPAHITTPAVHLRRADVAQTFHEELGLPLTDEVEVLTNAARQVLRQVFFEADIGLSGVNFGIAETGGICLVTNEGNGRMVTTIPRIHIALMGIERLVPTLEDLGLMLSLLPRASTGQKITVYTTLINRPRQAGDADGAHERHLILIDNGRMALKASPLAESLDCIRCGACLNACPVFREIGGHAYVGTQGQAATYPGPIGSIISPGLFGQEDFGHLARASSLCGACKDACPVDIDLPKLLLRVRAGDTQIDPSRHKPTTPAVIAWGIRGYTRLAISPSLYRIAQRSAGLLGRFIAPRDSWLRMPGFTGWGYSKDIPKPARQTFHQQWERLELDTSPAPPRSEYTDTAHKQLEPLISKPQSTPDLANKFADALTSIGGSFLLCSLQDLGSQILALIHEKQVDEILAWEDRHFPPGLLANLQQMGIEVKHELDASVRVGLTGATAAIAESGTLVVPGGSGKPNFPSLTTEVHLVVLRSGDIYKKLEDVLGLAELRTAPTVAMISGPSRTADIELTLTIGVHGPREVHVFCYEE